MNYLCGHKCISLVISRVEKERGKQTKMTLEWAYKQFATTVHIIIVFITRYSEPMPVDTIPSSNTDYVFHSIFYALLMTWQSNADDAMTKYIKRCDDCDASACKAMSNSILFTIIYIARCVKNMHIFIIRISFTFGLRPIRPTHRQSQKNAISFYCISWESPNPLGPLY